MLSTVLEPDDGGYKNHIFNVIDVKQNTLLPKKGLPCE